MKMKVSKKIAAALSLLIVLGWSSITLAQTCTGAGVLKLKVDKYHLVLVEKRPICITVPGEFKIKIKPLLGSTVDIHVGEVTVEEKSTSSPVTIRGTNDPVANKIVVKVELKSDKSVDPDDEFDFWIRVDGIGLLDPRVRVVSSVALMQFQYDAINEVLLEEFDLTLEEVRKIRPVDK
jgi:hypothetical protein